MANRSLTVALVVASFLAASALWFGLLEQRDARSDEALDYLRWELTTVPNKWLFAVGAPLRSDPSSEEALASYFALDDREGDEARRLENVVESIIEGRVDAVVREQGLNFPLRLPGVLAVWPPVDLELSGSPHVLVISPRAEITRVSDRALRIDLSSDELLALERDAEARDDSISALVVPTGGVAVYPSIVSNGRSYRHTVSTAAHEWTHHYLAFYPLGQSFFDSGDARTINETVADIVGEELGDAIIERFGDPVPVASEAATPTVDGAKVLRDLRVEVDALLAEGEIDRAEQRMAEVRDFLEENGIFIRRINQAYFAWYGTYAARADATDPLGPQLRELRERSGSLTRFLTLVREATSRADVEALLEDIRSDGQS